MLQTGVLGDMGVVILVVALPPRLLDTIVPQSAARLVVLFDATAVINGAISD